MKNERNFKFIFVDESGIPNKPKSKDSSYDTKYFALASAIINAENLADFENSIFNVLTSEGINPTVEFHASDLVHGTDKFQILTAKKRFNLIERILSEVVKLSSRYYIRVIGVIIEKSNIDGMPDKIYKIGVLRAAYRLLIERVCIELKDTNSLGVLVIDIPEKKEALNWKILIKEEITNGPYAKPDVLISIPMFVDSYTSRMIQLVDVLSYIIRRWKIVKEKTSVGVALSESDRKMKDYFNKYVQKLLRKDKKEFEKEWESKNGFGKEDYQNQNNRT